MRTFSDEAVQRALDNITDLHRDDPDFVSVEFDGNEVFVVRLLTEEVRTHVPSTITLEHPEGPVEARITREVGPAIDEALGRVDIDPAVPPAKNAGEMGGDECRNALTMGYYGTISFYAKIDFTVSGKCNFKCASSFALVSNNHVIGRSDAGKKGERIWSPFRDDTARLNCLVPFSCNPDVDLAIANVTDSNGIIPWTIRTIGRIAGVRRPAIGEAIRKHGARTGYTTGTVTGKTNIRVGSNTFRGVFATTGGFSCPGDSGSAVVGANGDLIGILSWGDVIACEKKPRGYFWALVKPGSFAKTDGSSAEIALHPQ